MSREISTPQRLGEASEQPLPTIAMWLTEPLGHDVTAALERLQRADDVQYIAVMPDVHLAEDICIGTVLATSHLLYPKAVGGDIGCGMAAIATDLDADWLDGEARAGKILAGLYQRVPALRHHRTRAVASLPDGLQELPLSTPSLERLRLREGRFQLGTLGRGNHFLELQRDRDGALWVMVHSGSRAMGQAIHAHHLDVIERSRAAASSHGEPASEMPCLNAERPEGQAYLQDVAWALAYARASRTAMLEQTLWLLEELAGAAPVAESYRDMHHNHVLREEHFGRQLWIHRKGANAAGPDVPGIIPGSMGTESFLVTGRGDPTALASSSHGAGRALRRKDAHRQISVRDLSRQMKGVWFDHRKKRKLLDEAPAAYKDIRAVMRAQSDLVRIEHTLTPLLSYKG